MHWLCGLFATQQRLSNKADANPCQFFYDCSGCGARLKSKGGECRVFCFFGDQPCSPMQTQSPKEKVVASDIV